MAATPERILPHDRASTSWRILLSLETYHHGSDPQAFFSYYDIRSFVRPQQIPASPRTQEKEKLAINCKKYRMIGNSLYMEVRGEKPDSYAGRKKGPDSSISRKGSRSFIEGERERGLFPQMGRKWMA
jgi:hypothetical protein